MEDKLELLAKHVSSVMIELSLILEGIILKMSMNNGEWGYDLYFDDPDFPRDLYTWLKNTDDADLVVSSMAAFLVEHNVMGCATLLSEGIGFYSLAERIVNQFNERMKELVMLFDDTVLLS